METRVGREEGGRREEGAARSMAGEGHGSGAAHQSAAATTSAGERSMAGGSGAAQQAATPSAAAGDRSMPGTRQRGSAAECSRHPLPSSISHLAHMAVDDRGKLEVLGRGSGSRTLPGD